MLGASILPDSEVVRRFDAVMDGMRDEAAALAVPVGDAAAEVGSRRTFGLALFVIILLIIATITFSLLWGGRSAATARADSSSVTQDTSARHALCAIRYRAARTDEHMGSSVSTFGV